MEEKIFKFSILAKFPGIIHGFSTRNYGDMRFGHLADEEIVKNRQHFCQSLNINLDDIVVARLIHGSKITTVAKEEKGRGARDMTSAIAQTDGLITKEKKIYLMITLADCIPIFVFDPLKQIVGIVHAGWRGVIAQIVGSLIAKLKNLGSEPADLIFALGPGICQKHFIVKDDVLEKFKEYYPSATFVRNHDGYIDLRKAILFDLKKEGVAKNNIEVASDCPACLNGRYGSFRKEGAGVPASAAIIGMRE